MSDTAGTCPGNSRDTDLTCEKVKYPIWNDMILSFFEVSGISWTTNLFSHLTNGAWIIPASSFFHVRWQSLSMCLVLSRKLHLMLVSDNQILSPIVFANINSHMAFAFSVFLPITWTCNNCFLFCFQVTWFPPGTFPYVGCVLSTEPAQQYLINQLHFDAHGL